MRQDKVKIIATSLLSALTAQHGLASSFTSAQFEPAIIQLQTTSFVNFLAQANVDVVRLDGTFWIEEKWQNDAIIEANFQGFTLDFVESDQTTASIRYLINAPVEVVDEIGNTLAHGGGGTYTIRCLSSVPVELEALLSEIEQANS